MRFSMRARAARTLSPRQDDSTLPAIEPMTAPRIGTGIAAWPIAVQRPTIAMSAHTNMPSSTSVSSEMFPALYSCTSGASPFTALTNAPANGADMSAQLVSAYRAPPDTAPMAPPFNDSTPTSFQSLAVKSPLKMFLPWRYLPNSADAKPTAAPTAPAPVAARKPSDTVGACSRAICPFSALFSFLRSSSCLPSVLWTAPCCTSP